MLRIDHNDIGIKYDSKRAKSKKTTFIAKNTIKFALSKISFLVP
jgi:hypothetical protein